MFIEIYFYHFVLVFFPQRIQCNANISGTKPSYRASQSVLKSRFNAHKKRSQYQWHHTCTYQSIIYSFSYIIFKIIYLAFQILFVPWTATSRLTAQFEVPRHANQLLFRAERQAERRAQVKVPLFALLRMQCCRIVQKEPSQKLQQRRAKSHSRLHRESLSNLSRKQDIQRTTGRSSRAIRVHKMHQCFGRHPQGIKSF